MSVERRTGLPEKAIIIREASGGDHAAVVAMLAPVIAAGETYALPRDMDAQALAGYWFESGKRTFVACDGEGALLGSYYCRANQMGGGAHVANCGYVTAPAAQGRGVARAMALHSFDIARMAGFTAMQFNFVVASNSRAVALWRSLGFEDVGRVPEAFAHPTLGLVDALILFRRL